MLTSGIRVRCGMLDGSFLRMGQTSGYLSIAGYIFMGLSSDRKLSPQSSFRRLYTETTGSRKDVITMFALEHMPDSAGQ
jgi:hypothetical protein